MEGTLRRKPRSAQPAKRGDMTAIYENGAGLDDAVRLARGFHAGSVWNETELDESAVRSFVLSMAENPNAFILVTPTGVVGGIVIPLWFAPTTKLGVEMFWYCERPGDGQRLRDTFERWARGSGANIIQFSCMVTDREGALRRMYRRAGFDAIEIGFRKAV